MAEKDNGENEFQPPLPDPRWGWKRYRAVQKSEKEEKTKMMTKKSLFTLLITLILALGMTTSAFAAGKIKAEYLPNPAEQAIPVATAPAPEIPYKPVLDCSKAPDKGSKFLCSGINGIDETTKDTNKVVKKTKIVVEKVDTTTTETNKVVKETKVVVDKIATDTAYIRVKVDKILKDTGAILVDVGAIKGCINCGTGAPKKSEKKESQTPDAGTLQGAITAAKPAPEKPKPVVKEVKVEDEPALERDASKETGDASHSDVSTTVEIPSDGSQAYAWALYDRFKFGILQQDKDGCVALLELVNADDNFDRTGGKEGYNYEQYFYPSLWKAAKVSYPICKNYSFGAKSQKQFRSTFVDGFTCGTGKDIGGRDCVTNPFMVIMQFLLDYGVFQMVCGGGDTCNSFGDFLDHAGIKDQGSPNYGPVSGAVINPSGNPTEGPGVTPGPANSTADWQLDTSAVQTQNTWQPSSVQINGYGPMMSPPTGYQAQVIDSNIPLTAAEIAGQQSTQYGPTN